MGGGIIRIAAPEGWRDFTPSGWVDDQTPDCTVEVKDVTTGLDVSTACYKYSKDGGSTWSSWLSAICTGNDGTTSYQTITASSVPFNQDSGTQNKIKFKIDDVVGNTGESDEYTVKIDDDDPSEPTTSSSTHPDENAWYPDNGPSFEWETPSDQSGIDGYSYVLGDSGSTTPDDTIDTTGNSGSYTDVADGIQYFHVRAKDNAGNWGGVDHYRVKIDTENPPAPVISSSTHPDEDEWYSGNDPSFTWTTPSDTSGIDCYSYTLDQSATITPDTTCEPAGNSKSYTDVADGIWYFHVRAKDNAGNWGDADHYRVKVGSGESSTTDACIALAIAAGSREYDSRGDVSGDGQVTSLDALMILQAVGSEP